MLKKLFLAIGLLCACTMTYAGSVTGTVSQIIVRDDGLHYVYINGEATNRAACAQKNDYWMIKDENSTYGKSQYSMLLAANASGKTVSIVGAGTCMRWKDGEDIQSISIK
ncbi:hypothetical protein [Photobacterium sp. 1_MG-2023]|uniref:hypothetical protein n=1 Tax=Photobacterium sp. 1_MG-2023 TaxID=3062646 RepID=UPI0026E18160|nr:hypothetical protein [Photobacterium sp. 1_MG-2023]MDO6708528.1 hypothetical protein [Photobacterium sp. 1_MG-2023]